jgi:hypothetical protein
MFLSQQHLDFALAEIGRSHVSVLTFKRYRCVEALHGMLQPGKSGGLGEYCRDDTDLRRATGKRVKIKVKDPISCLEDILGLLSAAFHSFVFDRARH